jgi:hypothetical protein
MVVTNAVEAAQQRATNQTQAEDGDGARHGQHPNYSDNQQRQGMFG